MAAPAFPPESVDARLFDVVIREDPTVAYEPSFLDTMAERGIQISITR